MTGQGLVNKLIKYSVQYFARCLRFFAPNRKPYTLAARPSEAGLNLITIAMIMLVVGLVVPPIMHLVSLERYQDRMIYNNLGQQSEIQTYLRDFVKENNRYPRPAPLTAGPGDVTYGNEMDVAAFAACSGWPMLAAGGCVAGAAPNEVYIGAVPFRSMGIPEEVTIDIYGHKVLYAVTVAQTVSYTDGDSAVQSAYLTPGGVRNGLNSQAVLISFGENGEGAYHKDGDLVRNCPAAASNENENCDMDTVFFATGRNHFDTNIENDPTPPPGPTNDNMMSAYSEVDVVYYDDSSRFIMSFPARPFDMSTPDQLWTEVERIGIGTESPIAYMDVNGDADIAGDIYAPEFCNFSGNDCFFTALIAGADSNMDCTGSLVGRIGGNKLFCQNALPNDASDPDDLGFVTPDWDSTTATGFKRNNKCALNELATGFDMNGDVLCAAPPSLP